MPAKGRPRQFDLDRALDEAVQVFWRHGYEGTTLDDLTAAMGINRPSLYAAFGNKEQVFAKALERYARVDMAYVVEAMAEPTARGVATHYLRENVLAVTREDRPAGCLSIQAGLSGSDEDQRVVGLLRESRGRGEAAMAGRMRAAVESGDLGPGEDPLGLAKFLATVSAGLAVQATSGATRAELLRVVERALTAFP